MLTAFLSNPPPRHRINRLPVVDQELKRHLRVTRPAIWIAVALGLVVTGFSLAVGTVEQAAMALVGSSLLFLLPALLLRHLHARRVRALFFELAAWPARVTSLGSHEVFLRSTQVQGQSHVRGAQVWIAVWEAGVERVAEGLVTAPASATLVVGLQLVAVRRGRHPWCLPDPLA